ncbi:MULTISPECIES: S8 family peptidase [Paenibacillus]|uniref:S8 family peptidase n=1 Tax=Paenibacillus TaxID=44249 RepID=UPI000BA577E9|nr:MULTISPECIES: S8 family peptidase [Paenibacillus]MBE7684324.1 S8 family serine peptidase [Paenibacillus sp. P13VS]MCM3208445.1 S8 family peptidase [Paenibacillus illinoisensis]PAD27866.1 peptidase S8 [Paenibacillus sp. 7523-1]
MDYTGFLHQLVEGMQRPEPEQAGRYLIRFAKPGQYEACLLELSRMRNEHTHLSMVRSSRLARSIIAPVHCPEVLDQYRDEITVEEDMQISLHATALHNKPATAQGVPWGVKQIRAPKVWSVSTGHRIKIGVIDTGADYHHPDLRYSLARGINLLNRSLLPHDDNGHGTHIAGTIAAANSTEGMIGVAPRSLIYPVKAFDHNGSAYVSDIVLGIDWCVRNRVDIINMSFGMKTRSKALLDVVNRAHQAGIVIVASSGNDGKRRSIDYPARYPQTISVGATDKNRRIASFSNRGAYVDVYAPGDKIISSWVQGKHHEMSGTSMATSHVSGAIALLLAKHPGLSPSEIKTLVKRATVPLRARKSTTAKSKVRGGEIDALRLMQEGGG